MENARLINEHARRWSSKPDSEVLQVINSPGNLVPVFDAVLDKAMRLCGATIGAIYRSMEWFDTVALRGVTPGLPFSAEHPLPKSLAVHLGRS